MGSARTKRRALGLLATVLTAGAMLVVPGVAGASRPLVGSPTKPVVVATGPVTISGSATLSNGCAPLRCETYLAIQQWKKGTWRTINYSRISYQTNPFSIQAVLTVDARYRTAVVDYEFLATPLGCGPAVKKIAGVYYNRYACGSGETAYRKTFASASVFIDVDDIAD
jgi:hypothetical protein